MYQVLIIDDEKPVRQAIMAHGHWEELGIDRIYEALEGESGLAILRESCPDIVMVDMKMPRMDGVRFLEIAAQEYPRIKYIVISGYDDFEYTRPAIRAKVLDYLLKPVIEAELNAVLRRAVGELNRERQQETASDILNQVNRFASNERVFWKGRLEKQPHRQSQQKKYLHAIRDYIDQNYFREITLQDFAGRYFLSKEYLSKLFREEFGYNIYAYVLRIRMAKARELLADPEMKVLTIAEHLGYQDHNYFSRAFKTYYGMTPTEYREEGLKR